MSGSSPKKDEPKVNGESSVEFRIRTSQRRHLDLDQADQSQWLGAFHFVQAADSQFGMIDSYTHKRVEPGWEEEKELCERLVAACNAMQPKPKFLIICGDLADAWPGTELRQRQVSEFKRIFAKLDAKIPLVCVCGNHDVGDQPTMASVKEYRDNFGDDYFHFTFNQVLFIVINSQFYQHRANLEQYAKQQDDWLMELLGSCKQYKHSIIFEHIPWFLEQFDEPDDYFNIRKEVRLEWLRRFQQAGVSKIMCGHYHRNAGGWYENMELVVTSAIGAQLGEDQSGVRLVKLTEDSIEHQYYAMQDIPKRVEFGEDCAGTDLQG